MKLLGHFCYGNLFCHMKDEPEYKTRSTSIRVFRDRIVDYTTYYNSSRYQWGLQKTSPVEFRSHLFAA
ncbi:IS3 family transposase [Brevibacillus halotolerans]|uniref:IS3 family transposase n=1 Tax=Brevibacillus halotolerans TaxID=1507437 RepID=UPI003D16B813